MRRRRGWAPQWAGGNGMLVFGGMGTSTGPSCRLGVVIWTSARRGWFLARQRPPSRAA